MVCKVCNGLERGQLINGWMVLKEPNGLERRNLINGIERSQ